MQIITQDVEDVFGLLDSLDHLVEIQKQSTRDKAEGPEEKTMRVLKFAEGYEHVEAGIIVLEDTDWNKQRVAATRQGVMIVACFEEIPKERMGSASRQTSVLDFLKSSSGTLASQTVLVETLFNEEVPPPYTAVCQISCTL